MFTIIKKIYSGNGEIRTIIGSENKNANNYYFEDEKTLFFLAGNPLFRINGKFKGKKINEISKKYFLSREFDPVDFASQLKDYFVFIWINKELNHIFVFTDVLGLYPVFYKKSEHEIIISDSIISFNSEDINDSVLTDLLISNYLLDNTTYKKNVYRLRAGEYLEYIYEKLNIKRYYNEISLLSSNRKNVTIQDISELFEKVVLQMLGLNNGLTLTGGFDSRTIMAVLLSKKIQSEYITFGYEKSSDVYYANNTVKNLGLELNTFKYNKEFEKCMFNNFRNQFIISNGYGSIFRTYRINSVYEISKKSKTIFFGYGGSEIIRGLWPDGLLISDLVKSMLLDPSLTNRDISNIIYNSIKFLKKSYQNILEERINQLLKLPYLDRNKFNVVERNFLFLYYEILPKHFGAYFTMHQPSIVTRAPFMDIEIIEMIMQSGYSIFNSPVLSKSPFLRWKGQIFYTKLINNFYKKLLFIKTGKGYIPAFLLNKYFLPFAASSYLLQKLINKKFIENFSYGNWFKKLCLDNMILSDQWIEIDGFKKEFEANCGTDEYSLIKYANIINFFEGIKL